MTSDWVAAPTGAARELWVLEGVQLLRPCPVIADASLHLLSIHTLLASLHRFVARGEGGDWMCDWTVRPQTYMTGEGPVQGCHMLAPGASVCTACRRFAGDLECVPSCRSRAAEAVLGDG